MAVDGTRDLSVVTTAVIDCHRWPSMGVVWVVVAAAAKPSLRAFRGLCTPHLRRAARGISFCDMNVPSSRFPAGEGEAPARAGREPAEGRRWRVAVADDHRVIRDGIAALLRGYPDFEYAGEASSGTELPGLVERTRPDVLVTDLSMPGITGMAFLRGLRERHQEVFVVVLTMHATLLAMQEAFEAGAHAFVAKDDSFADFVGILRRVCAGEKCVCSQTLETLGESERAPQLTTREREVLELMTRGFSSKEIGAQLGISQRTVEIHRGNLFQKFKVTKVTELVALALASGVVPMTPATLRDHLSGL
jgi:DNA-binding NarL/FixJ family response regulator